LSISSKVVTDNGTTVEFKPNEDEDLKYAWPTLMVVTFRNGSETTVLLNADDLMQLNKAILAVR
jgi:hypothetical protein